jgi:hypothetical protein
LLVIVIYLEHLLYQSDYLHIGSLCVPSAISLDGMVILTTLPSPTRPVLHPPLSSAPPRNICLGKGQSMSSKAIPASRAAHISYDSWLIRKRVRHMPNDSSRSRRTGTTSTRRISRGYCDYPQTSAARGARSVRDIPCQLADARSRTLHQDRVHTHEKLALCTTVTPSERG